MYTLLEEKGNPLSTLRKLINYETVVSCEVLSQIQFDIFALLLSCTVGEGPPVIFFQH